MIHNSKFSGPAYMKYDILGKIAVIIGLDSKGLKGSIISDKKLPYGVDILVSNPSSQETYYNEPEVKEFWKDHDFPDLIKNEGIDIPARKEKYLQLDKPVYLCIVNKPLTRFAAIKGELLKEALLDQPNKFGVKLIKKEAQRFFNGKKVVTEELYYRVPITVAKIVEIPEDKKIILSKIRDNWCLIVDKLYSNSKNVKKMFSEINQKLTEIVSSKRSLDNRLMEVLDFISNEVNIRNWWDISKKEFMEGFKQ